MNDVSCTHIQDICFLRVVLLGGIYYFNINIHESDNNYFFPGDLCKCPLPAFQSTPSRVGRFIWRIHYYPLIFQNNQACSRRFPH
jgi:hypothetical protein